MRSLALVRLGNNSGSRVKLAFRLEKRGRKRKKAHMEKKRATISGKESVLTISGLGSLRSWNLLLGRTREQFSHPYFLTIPIETKLVQKLTSNLTDCDCCVKYPAPTLLHILDSHMQGKIMQCFKRSFNGVWNHLCLTEGLDHYSLFQPSKKFATSR